MSAATPPPLRLSLGPGPVGDPSPLSFGPVSGLVVNNYPVDESGSFRQQTHVSLSLSHTHTHTFTPSSSNVLKRSQSIFDVALKNTIFCSVVESIETFLSDQSFSKWVVLIHSTTHPTVWPQVSHCVKRKSRHFYAIYEKKIHWPGGGIWTYNLSLNATNIVWEYLSMHIGFLILVVWGLGART